MPPSLKEMLSMKNKCMFADMLFTGMLAIYLNADFFLLRSCWMLWSLCGQWWSPLVCKSEAAIMRKHVQYEV